MQSEVTDLIIRESDKKMRICLRDGTPLTGWHADYYRCQDAARKKLRNEKPDER